MVRVTMGMLRKRNVRKMLGTFFLRTLWEGEECGKGLRLKYREESIVKTSTSIFSSLY